jgi:pimeloyl-ACP methyl ester carboxylesterase
LAVGAPDLARSRRVYAPDLLGLVGSANKTADYSPAFFARFVAAYFDALEIERAAVVGTRWAVSSPCA